jgi:hypothetical protein
MTMKRLLLALLLCLTAVAGIGQAPDLSAACDVWLTRSYYESPGGAFCGYRTFRCESSSTIVGCQTPYYRDTRSSCSCQ